MRIFVNKILLAIIATIASVLSFALCLRVSATYFENSAVQLSNAQASGLVAVISIIVAVCVFLFIEQLRFGIYRHAWILITFLYAIILCYLLFMKNVGDQAFNISLAVFWQDFKQDYGRECLNNVLAFLPLPIVLWGLNITPQFIYVAIAFIMVELAQFTFSLGAFDIGDLISYFIAYSIGRLFIRLWSGIYNIFFNQANSRHEYSVKS